MWRRRRIGNESNSSERQSGTRSGAKSIKRSDAPTKCNPIPARMPMIGQPPRNSRQVEERDQGVARGRGRPPYSVLASFFDAGLGDRVLAVGAGAQGRWPIQRQLVDFWRELVIVIHHLIKRNDLAGVRGEAAHRRHQARLRSALHFVVRLVLADGGDQVIPLPVIGRPLRLLERPYQVLRRRFLLTVLPTRDVLTRVNAGAARRVRVR